MIARTQDEHARINAREYPGTRELCCECDSPTGRAGRGEDSLYTDDDRGPFCEECWAELEAVTVSDKTKAELRRRCPTPEEVDALLDKNADLRQRVEAAEREIDGFERANGMWADKAKRQRKHIRTLKAALRGLLQVVEDNKLIPESVSYMRQARESLAAPQPPAQDGDESNDAMILRIASDPATTPLSLWWLKDTVTGGDVRKAVLRFGRALLASARDPAEAPAGEQPDTQRDEALIEALGSLEYLRWSAIDAPHVNVNEAHRCAEKVRRYIEQQPTRVPDTEEASGDEALGALSRLADGNRTRVSGSLPADSRRDLGIVRQALRQQSQVPDDREDAIWLVAEIMDKFMPKPPGPSDGPFDFQPKFARDALYRQAKQAIEQAGESGGQQLRVPNDVPDRFVDWITHEMPQGTHIHDPGWWAPRIWRAVRRAIRESEGGE